MSKTEKILLIIVATVFTLSYFRVPFLFFQQDELLGFGYLIKIGSEVIMMNGLHASGIRHFVPVSLSISCLIFKIFGLNYFAYNIVALLIHAINGFLIYILSKSIFKNKLIPFVSVLFFFGLSVASELVMWPVVNINMISLTFSLILWILIINENFFRNIKGLSRGIVVSILFLLSVLSIEYSLGLLVFVPMAVILYHNKNFKKTFKILIPFAGTSMAYILFRIVPILTSKKPGDVGMVAKESFIGKTMGFVVRYVGQIFVGQVFFLKASNVIGKLFGPMDKKEVFVENSIFPIVVLFSGIFILTLCLFFYKKTKRNNKELSVHFLTALFFLLSSTLPFIFVPGEAGNASIISSRYLYFGIAGVSIILSFFVDKFSKNEKYKYYTYLVIILIVSFGTITNLTRANKKYEDGMARKEIIENIIKKYPKLPKKVIFYTESDSPYFGLSDEEKIMPFQSGFGQTLLVFYNEVENFPKDFFPGKYLWEIDSQGYEEYGERGFGYARKLGTLEKLIKENNLEVDSILAFSWKDDTNSLVDITDIIKEIIKNYK